MAVKLAYDEYGAGAAIIILHGLFGSARNWQAIAKRLASNYRVYALDLRNHGRSPWADTMAYEDLAEDVRAFIVEQGLERVTALGHSMGGKTAMVLALAHPQLVDALIIADIAPVSYPHSFLPYVQAMQELNLAGLSRRDQVDAALSGRIPDAAIRLFLLQNLVFRDQHFDWRLNLPVLAASVQALAGFPQSVLDRRFDGKTLFFYGANSTYVQPEHLDTIRRLFPSARLRALADAGHWLHVDQHQRFLEVVAAFLKESHSG